jgi:hypothetical protein
LFVCHVSGMTGQKDPRIKIHQPVRFSVQHETNLII